MPGSGSRYSEQTRGKGNRKSSAAQMGEDVEIEVQWH